MSSQSEGPAQPAGEKEEQMSGNSPSDAAAPASPATPASPAAAEPASTATPQPPLSPGVAAETTSALVPRSLHPLAPLAQPACIRARCAGVLQAVDEGRSGYFKIDRPALQPLVQRLTGRLNERLNEPLSEAPNERQHSPAADASALAEQGWWRLLQAGGRDRLAELDGLLEGKSSDEQLQARLDLCVLLAVLGSPVTAPPDAGWRYDENRALAATAFTRAPADELLALLDQSARKARAADGQAAQRAAPAASAQIAVAEGAASPQPASVDAPLPLQSPQKEPTQEPAPTQDAAPASAPDVTPVVTPVRTPDSTPTVTAEPASTSTSPAPLPSPSNANPAPAADASSSAAAAAAPAAPAALPAVPGPAAVPGQGHGGELGLVLACFRAFVAGVFSDQAGDPCRVDASSLRHADAAALRAVFQGRADNPVSGLEARAGEIARLAQILAEQSAAAKPARANQLLALAAPGLDPRAARAHEHTGQPAGQPAGASGNEPAVKPGADPATGHHVDAGALFAQLVPLLSPVWAQGSRVQGLPAGDVWPHAFAGAATGLKPPSRSADETAQAQRDEGSPGVAAARPPEAPAPTPGERLHGVAGSRSLSTMGWVPLQAATLVLVNGVALPLARAGRSLQGLDALPAPALPALVQAFIEARLIQPRHAKAWQPAQLSQPGTVEARAISVLLFDELMSALAPLSPTPAAVLAALLD